MGQWGDGCAGGNFANRYPRGLWETVEQPRAAATADFEHAERRYRAHADVDEHEWGECDDGPALHHRGERGGCGREPVERGRELERRDGGGAQDGQWESAARDVYAVVQHGADDQLDGECLRHDARRQ